MSQSSSKYIIPNYPNRKGFLPTGIEHYGNGGAYPEIHIVQYPLNMGKPGVKSNALIAVDVDEKGQIRYDAIVKQGTNKNKIVQTNFNDLKEKQATENALVLPTDDEESKVTEKTKKALEELLNGKISASKPLKVTETKEAEPTYIRYTPNPNSAGYSEASQQRVIKMVEAQVDPMEPPKHPFKKVPRGPVEDPVPVLHSPPRKLTVADQQAWKIPPCVSNWKNAKGFIIPLDKRLAADGRGLQEITINNKFATLSESLYVAERKASEDLRIRNQIRKKMAIQEKEEREKDLREMAAQARLERAGVLGGNNIIGSSEEPSYYQQQSNVTQAKTEIEEPRYVASPSPIDLGRATRDSERGEIRDSKNYYQPRRNAGDEEEKNPYRRHTRDESDQHNSRDVDREPAITRRRRVDSDDSDDDRDAGRGRSSIKGSRRGEGDQDDSDNDSRDSDKQARRAHILSRQRDSSQRNGQIDDDRFESRDARDHRNDDRYDSRSPRESRDHRDDDRYESKGHRESRDHRDGDRYESKGHRESRDHRDEDRYESRYSDSRADDDSYRRDRSHYDKYRSSEVRDHRSREEGRESRLTSQSDDRKGEVQTQYSKYEKEDDIPRNKSIPEDISDNEDNEDDYEDSEEVRKERVLRERLRVEKRKERERELRLENMKGNMRKSKLDRDTGRDISEKIALGLHKGSGKLTGESMFDSRLFNQSSGISSGFGADDEYSAFTKPLFDRGEAASIYRPRKSDVDVYGDADTQIAKLADTSRFKPDKGFKGAESGGGIAREAPVQFERSNQDGSSSKRSRHEE